jgi:ABC-2 type transport system permease protein
VDRAADVGTVPAEAAGADTGRRVSMGWTVVARKELADHVLSARFAVLLIVLGLAAVGSVYSVANAIRDVAPNATGTPGLFLLLFTEAADPIPFPFFVFVGFLAPLLGIAFGFDSINSERSQGTLPRLVSQPIHRDDVINGKFAAGLAVIGIMLTALVLLVAGIGIVRLGIVPTFSEVARLFVWLLVAIVYVGLWLAFATLCSVLARRAATSALIAIAVWLVLALFGALLASLLAGVISPAGPPGTVEELANLRTTAAMSRLSPITLFQEATQVLLNPSQRAVGVVTVAQIDQALPSTLPLGQSLLIVWPQVVGLVALTVVCFAAAYISFMRQEIRA